MAEPAETVRLPHLSTGLSRRAIAATAVTLVILMLCLRAACELAMMWQHGSDPQMAIWGMFLLVKLALWFLAGGLAAGFGFVVIAWPRRWGFPLMIAWAAMISVASWKYYLASQALAATSDPATSAEQLGELVHFNGIQAGYEIDNRLASNPNTPPKALRELSKRDQLGTQMCLTRNKNTPDDVRKRLAAKKK